VAALTAEAVGRTKVLGLFLPCYSHKTDLADAKSFAIHLRIRTEYIDLKSTYDELTGILPKGSPAAKANLKPRLRMQVLYYFSNNLNYLVCGTGNKSELMAGYFTKYGDGGCDILPIGDLFKKQVKDLAVELGIPKRIIDKPPTAGLWAGQTDEKEMGIRYAQLDDILERLQSGKKQVLPAGKVNKVKKMISRSRHKRELPRIFMLKHIQKGGMQ